MLFLLNRFLKDESGATAIEYALLASLISVAMIVSVTSLGNSISNKFNDLALSLNAVKSPEIKDK